MEPSEIIGKFKSYIDKDPGDPRFARVGEAFLNMGDLKNALAVLTRGVKANPRYPTGQLILANGLRQAGYLPQAKERFKVVLRLDSSNIAALWQLASIAFEEGEENEGIRYLKKIMLINPYLNEAREELKNRTGKEFGPPQPPKPKIEPQLPIPTAQEGPIVVKKDKEEIEEGFEGLQEVVDAASENTAKVVSEKPPEPVQETRIEESKPAASEDFEELFEMDVSEMEVIEEAPKEKPLAVEDQPSDKTEFEEQPAAIAETELVHPQTAEITAKPEKKVADARIETLKKDAPPKIDEEKPVWAVEPKPKAGGVLGRGGINIAEDTILFEETPDEEKPHKDEDLVDFGSLSKKKEPIPEDIVSPETPEDTFDDMISPDFSGRMPTAVIRPEPEIPDDKIPVMPQEEVIEVSSPEELAKLIGADRPDEIEEKEVAEQKIEEKQFFEKDTDPDAEPRDFFGDEQLEPLNAEEAGLGEIESPIAKEEQLDDAEDVVVEEVTEDVHEEDFYQPENELTEPDLSEFEELGLNSAEETSENGIKEIEIFEVEENIEATEEPLESPENGEIEIEENFFETEQSETEKLNGLITRNGFDPPAEEDEEQINGIIKSGEFKRPELLDDSIEGLLAREEFVPEIAETDFEKIEGLDVNREFVPDSEDKSETEEQEDEPKPELYTVTMAEIYAAQGQIENALWIYDKILERTVVEEDRARIEQRVAHLRKGLEEEA